MTLHRIKIEEYTITQLYNYDVQICKDGKMVLHAIKNKKCSDDELTEILKAYKEIKSGI